MGLGLSQTESPLVPVPAAIATAVAAPVPAAVLAPAGLPPSAKSERLLLKGVAHGKFYTTLQHANLNHFLCGHSVSFPHDAQSKALLTLEMQGLHETTRSNNMRDDCAAGNLLGK